MSIVILTHRDDGDRISSTVELAERVLEACPDATVRMVKGSLQGVEVSDRAAVKYLMTTYTASGNKRKKGA